MAKSKKSASKPVGKAMTAEQHRKIARDHDARADLHRASASKHRAMATLKTPMPKKGNMDFGY